MSFSKVTLFAAALLGSAALMHAAEMNLDKTGSFSGDIKVGSGADLKINLSDSYTISGTLLSAQGAIGDRSDFIAAWDNPIAWDRGGTFVNADVEVVTISGGGILSYEGGAGTGYYTNVAQLIPGMNSAEMVCPVWDGMDSFWSSGAFTGTVVVGNNTTLSLKGQLTQYVELYRPNPVGQPTPAERHVHGFAGVSGMELKSGSTLSFENSLLNLPNSRPNIWVAHPFVDYLPTGASSLNFINNLTATQDSKIVIGTDENSLNRIFLNTDDDKVSTVGQLSGNGRFYTVGDGTVVFYGVSNLNSGNRTDSSGKIDTTGNTWKEGNNLADIVLANDVVYVGANGIDVADSVAVENAVDDVFKNATAVQLGYCDVSYGNDNDNVISEFPYRTVENRVNVLAVYTPDSSGSVKVAVYGNQTFNNFQSLWAERSALMQRAGDVDFDDMLPTETEPVYFSYITPYGSKVYSQGDGCVRVAGGSVLTINQDEYRDGWYEGVLYTDTEWHNANLTESVGGEADMGDGLIVKTGKGRFWYTPFRWGWETQCLSQLRIEEGEWITDVGALDSTAVHLEDIGQLTLQISEVSTESGFYLNGQSPDAVLALVRTIKIQNDLTDEGLDVANGGGALDETHYRTRGVTTEDNPAVVQFISQQTLFYGTVEVKEGVTLVLGVRDDDTSKSIFSSAAGIKLLGNGSLDDRENFRKSTLVLSGTQIVRNLSGESDKSHVNISNAGTLVLLNSSDDYVYTGGFSGAGNFVKFGDNVQRMSPTASEDFSGTIAVFAGSVDVAQSAANEGPRSVVLHNSSSITFGGPSKIGSLVGTAGSTVSFSGDLTVGGVYVPDADFLKNPGELVYLKGSSVEDRNGAFMKLYATTDASVFKQMQANEDSEIFKYGNATTVRDWLKAVFTEEDVAEFFKSGKTQLSESMADSLTALAADISGGSVDSYLDAEGNLNAPGWNKIVAASGLEFLKWKFADETLYGTVLADLLEGTDYDSSLYGFITAFVGKENYKFILTEGNARLISSDYAVKSTGWFTYSGGEKKPDYNAFAESFGLDAGTAASGEFAGTLSGVGNLQKIGPNELKLTGVSTYTGKTIVDGGTLSVKWNSIQNTSAVSVADGANLVISANKTDSFDAGDGVSQPLGDAYGKVFRKDTMRLSGEGVVTKIGDGNVDLGAALLDVEDGEADFTGTFVLEGGAVKANVDAAARVLGEDALAFGIDYKKAARFELSFANSVDTTLALTGKVSDAGRAGTFSVDAGESNTLEVSAKDFSVGTVNLVSGAMNVIGNAATLTVNDIILGASTELSLSLKQDLSSSADIRPAGKTAGGRLVVSASDKDAAGNFIARTATLSGNDLTGISALKLSGGANLVLSNLTAPAEVVTLTELDAADSTTALTIGANRTLSLTIGEGEVSTLAGTLHGSGTLVFNGAKSVTDGVADGALVIGSENAGSGTAETVAFGGEIRFESGTISLVAGEGKTLNYTGLSITADPLLASEARTLTKDGAGTVNILATDADAKNSVSGKNLDICVNGGELAVSGKVFSNGSLPDSLAIATGATFRLCDPFTTGSFLDLADLGTLTGTGKLAFESASAQTVAVSEFDPNAFSGIIEVGQNITMELAAGVTDFSAFSGEGTLNVQTSNLTVHVNANADGLEKFAGTITGNSLTELTIVGEGTLVLLNVPSGVTEINVGSATQNGGVGVSADWAGNLNVQGTESRVLISGLGDSVFAGTTTIGDGVRDLTLATDGTIVLGNDALKNTFKLEGATAASVTLSNIAGENLILKNLTRLGNTNEDYALKTAQNGAIVFDGSSDGNAVRSFAETSAPDVGVWSKDISGEGGVALKNGADLTLTAEALSYTGATTVGAGTTLSYAATNGGATVSASSGLLVDCGGTVVGGVDLVSENSTVEFSAGSRFVFTGEAIRFTGTAAITGWGIINVTLADSAVASRGIPVSLFEYIGEAGTEFGKNGISLDQIKFDGNVRYYADTAGTDAYTSGKTVIYVATDDLASVPGVDLHEGLSNEFVAALSEIAKPDDGALNPALSAAEAALAEAIIKTPNGSLAGTLNNLSPLSYGAMLALPQSGFISDMAAVSARIEQRRYDNYSSFIWETHRDWEFFAQAQGSFAEADEASDTRTFDMNTYGAIAGMDVKLSAETVAGFAFSYDYGDADIHNGGGDIKSHDIRATAFFGKLLEKRFYVDSGAQVGFAMYDVDRNTAIGKVDGDTTGWHAGAFANFGMLVNLMATEDEKTNLNLMPYFGLAYSYYGVNAFDESGAATALDTDSFGASSLRATLGASLVLTTPCFGHSSRVNLDFAYTRELLDSEAEIDYAMPGMFKGESFKSDAKAFAEDTFSIGPRFSFDIDRNTSIYCGYRFEMSTDSDVSHSVNLGYRSRF